MPHWNKRETSIATKIFSSCWELLELSSSLLAPACVSELLANGTRLALLERSPENPLVAFVHAYSRCSRRTCSCAAVPIGARVWITSSLGSYYAARYLVRFSHRFAPLTRVPSHAACQTFAELRHHLER